jgi:hypothetical protein
MQIFYTKLINLALLALIAADQERDRRQTCLPAGSSVADRTARTKAAAVLAVSSTGLFARSWDIPDVMTPPVVTRTTTAALAAPTDKPGSPANKGPDVVTRGTTTPFAAPASENVNVAVPVAGYAQHSVPRIIAAAASVSFTAPASDDEEVRFPIHDYYAI